MILLLFLYVYLGFTSGTQNVTCGDYCICHGDTMTCTDSNIPRHIPRNITEIFFQDVNFEDLAFHIHSRSQEWSAIDRLTLESTSSKDIRSRMFENLNNLAYLKIKGDQFRYIHKSAFVGLVELKTLDLSNNGALSFESVGMALTFTVNGTCVLQNLKTLNISWIGMKSFTPVDMTEEFFADLANGRQLKHLDISHINLGVLDIRNFYPLCDNGLESLVMKSSVISSVSYCYIPGKQCSNLKTLELQGSLFASGILNYISLLSEFQCTDLVFYYTIDTLNLNDIFKIEMLIGHPDLQFVANLSGCPFQFRRIVFAYNQLKYLNVSVLLHPTTAKTIHYLDLSNNVIEYLSPDLLSPSVNLLSLNISNNKLQTMNHRLPGQFKRLLLPLKHLEEIGMSRNQLEDLPADFFSGNPNLKRIDLSYNKLRVVSFKINNLDMLKVLNLSGNDFHGIDAHTFIMFQSSSSLFVDLRNNPLECGCKDTDTKLVDWIRIHAKQHAKSGYYCDYDGKRFDIVRHSTKEDIENDCALRLLKTALAVSIPTGVVLVAVFVVTAVLVRRHRMKREAILKVIKQIRKGEFRNEFLVFLCFASDDMELIDQDIYPHLNSTFEDITGVDKEFTCKGDFNFRPGYPILVETERCLNKCSVVVAAVSRTFCQRHWCERELLHAFNTGKPIILLMLEKVDRKQMSPVINQFFATFVHASLIKDGDESKLVPDWSVLCKSILELAGKQPSPLQDQDLPEEEPEIVDDDQILLL